jgi:hypothetical protein
MLNLNPCAIKDLDPLHLLSNGEGPVLLKARALWSFAFKCKSKKAIISSLLRGPDLKANGEDPCTAINAHLPSHIFQLNPFHLNLPIAPNFIQTIHISYNSRLSKSLENM